jgi:hypothetical protein
MKKLFYILYLIVSLVFFPAFSSAQIDFDGSDDLVNIGKDTSLGFTSAISLSAWINIDTAGGGGSGRIIDNLDTGFTPWHGFTFLVIAGSSEFRTRFQFASGTLLDSADDAITGGEWTHVSLVYDKDAGANNKRLYVNGVLSAQATDTATLVSNAGGSGDDCYIGEAANFVRSFDGKIAEVALWNNDLTAQELLHLSSGVRRMPLQVQPSALVAYLPLDDEEDGSSCDGDTFIDMKNRVNDGTGDDGAGNDNLTAVAGRFLSYP